LSRPLPSPRLPLRVYFILSRHAQHVASPSSFPLKRFSLVLHRGDMPWPTVTGIRAKTVPETRESEMFRRRVVGNRN
jgi:hypothetical protein